MQSRLEFASAFGALWSGSASHWEYDVTTNLIASLIAAIVTYVAVAVFRLRIPSFARILFWRKFVQDFVIVVSEVPGVYDPDAKTGVQPPLTPIGDALVLGEFLKMFRSDLRLDPLVVSAPSHASLDGIRHRNLLIIGGPKYNVAAEECLSELDELLPYQFRRLRPRVGKRELIDSDMKKFVGRADLPELVQDATQERDYGAVVMATNPFDHDKKVLIVAGLSNISTTAPFHWMLRQRARFWIRAARSGGFEAVVRCRNMSPTRVSNVEVVHLQFF